MTFEEWWSKFLKDSRDFGSEPDGIASVAWHAATEEAVRRTIETAKRYTCEKMIGVCTAIAYEIQRRDS